MLCDFRDPVEWVCQDCGETKPISRFPRNIVQPDGISVRCYVCSQEWKRYRAFERELEGR